MTAVWELRVFGIDRAGHTRRKVYTFVVDEQRHGLGYERASTEAKRLARLDGLSDPRVWAATRIREVPSEPRAKYLTSSSPWGLR